MPYDYDDRDVSLNTAEANLLVPIENCLKTKLNENTEPKVNIYILSNTLSQSVRAQWQFNVYFDSLILAN